MVYARPKSFWLPGILFLFFLFFLALPLKELIEGGFYFEGRWNLDFLFTTFENPFYQECFTNSLKIATFTTLISLFVCFPIAWIFEKFEFPLKKVFFVFLLLPLFYPPFLTAYTLKQFFAPYGSLNLFLSSFLTHPIDWLGDRSLGGVLMVSILHAIPMMLLILRSSIRKMDASLLDASRNLGATSYAHCIKVLIPLAFPGLYAGGTLVFIGSFTDLGAPLMFEYAATVPTQIFNLISQPNQPTGYLLVCATLLLISILFLLAQKHLTLNQSDFSSVRSSYSHPLIHLTKNRFTFLFLFLIPLAFLSALPFLLILLNSFSQEWFMSPLPTQWTTLYWKEAFQDPLIQTSLQNSFSYSLGACLFNLIFGIAIAYCLTRKTFPGKQLLKLLSLIPMALPGIVLAFAYAMTWTHPPFETWTEFWKKWIDPRESPLLLMIFCYGIHRLPFMTHLLISGYASISITLEQAAQNLGASRLVVLRKITLPLLRPSLVAGTLMVFAFSIFEVSSGMILTQESQFYPISKAIYAILNRIPLESYAIASAFALSIVIFIALLLLSTPRPKNSTASSETTSSL